jgi:hypothetical protein
MRCDYNAINNGDILKYYAVGSKSDSFADVSIGVFYCPTWCVYS